MLIILFITIGVAGTLGQSKAHDSSRFAIIDPAYDSEKLFPASIEADGGTPWIYGPGELESWRLQLLIRRVDTAELKVSYPGAYYVPKTKGIFQLELKDSFGLNEISFTASGSGRIYINNSQVAVFDKSSSAQTITFEENVNAERLRFEVDTEAGSPALKIVTDAVSTLQDWKWKSEDGWTEVVRFPANSEGLPPHLTENPTVMLSPESLNENVFDFGRELFGHIVIESVEKPIFNVGESEAEAVDIDNEILEQSVELIQLQPGKWKTKVPVAFRYVYAEDIDLADVLLEAIFHPSRYAGAFACSDSILTRIWMYSAYTLRLCMQDFLLDGIKRDRLPWSGDLAMSLWVNAFTFKDQELVRRSLVALGREGIEEEDINGIVDYSLWWIISQDQYQLYYDDKVHLETEWDRIKEALHVLQRRSTESGFLPIKEDDWVFIDWVDQEKWTALQILWWWAQTSGANIADRVGEVEFAQQLRENAESLKNRLHEVAWNSDENVWLSSKDRETERTRHPNFLAVVSGLASEQQYSGIQTLLENDEVKPVGTPYMAGFENMAVAIMGNTRYMLDQVKRYWGGMLDMGATTFWEAYDESLGEKEEQYSFYGRPYAKSLDHAWSSGPAAFLPARLFGLKPLEDGWKRFTINPNLDYLEWASVTVPTNYGIITADIEKGMIHISVPKGTILEWKGKSIKGPRKLTDKF
ncbi:MAG: alpha-L-rhamnosidase C-terminal domain-containing protein [Prolixibacteraceae bacterium]